MNWYPCIGWGGDRWWLPRSAESTNLLALVLLRAKESDSDSLRRSVVAQLATDPTLFLYCALQVEQEEVHLGELAQWLIANAGNKFACGDNFISAPETTPSGIRQTERLLDQYANLPLDRWMDDAVLWLEAFGPKVPLAWIKTWPTVVPEAVTLDHSAQPAWAGPPVDALQLLARTTEHHHRLTDSFDVALRESKLAALTQLAYGLSHEINNPLANISTRAQLLLRDEADPDRRDKLQRMVDQVYRAHQMIADLMFFANPPQMQLETCDGSEIVEEVVASLETETQRQAIRVETSLRSTALWNVDRKMVGEAIRVLIRNAIEAIGHGGTIVVSTSDNGTGCRIHVADSGPGLSAEARDHAFDPYFSGREAGRGLGLGLCRSYRIAQLHHAEISLASGPAGCVATIALKNQANK